MITVWIVIIIVIFSFQTAYAQSMKEYKWDSLPVTVDIRNVPANKKYLVIESIKEWQKFFSFKITNKTDSNIIIYWVNRLPFGDKSFVGITNHEITNDIHKCKIYISPKNYYSNLEIKQIIVHELGHSIGLDHSMNVKDIMFNTIKKENRLVNKYTLISPADADALKNIYYTSSKIQFGF
jgi:predicted Zn-dependent protease